MMSLWLAPVWAAEPQEQFVPGREGKNPNNIPPAGASEASICGDIKGLAVLTYGGARNAWPMKAANT